MNAPAVREEAPQQGDSTLSVALALGANVLVGVLKLVVGLLTGSSAMLSEAARSVADCTTEVLLFTALRRSGKQPDRVLLCARLDFVDSLSAGDLERACVRLDEELRERFDDLVHIVVEPVPRSDPGVRAAVMERYGTLMPDWRHEATAPD